VAGVEPFLLAQQTHAAIRSRRWQVAVLPFGATEPHNLHLPYGTDTFQVEAVARRACAWAFERGAEVLLLPAVPFGVNSNHLQVPGGVALSLQPTTLYRIVADLVDALERQGIRKVVLVNGHGGNELKPVLRELYGRTRCFVCLCDWFRVAADQYPRLFSCPGEHADEVETSMALAFFPELVQMEAAGRGAARPTRFQAIEQGWVTITRPWHLATADTGIGDPRAAHADKGRQLMAVLEERLGQFLLELASTPLDETFPYAPETDERPHLIPQGSGWAQEPANRPQAVDAANPGD